jgi:hypothetical protein
MFIFIYIQLEGRDIFGEVVLLFAGGEFVSWMGI